MGISTILGISTPLLLSISANKDKRKIKYGTSGKRLTQKRFRSFYATKNSLEGEFYLMVFFWIVFLKTGFSIGFLDDFLGELSGQFFWMIF